MTTYAYCRVSTREQNLARQIEAMKQTGIPLDHISCEQQSGRDMNRPIWLNLKARMQPGDTLTIKSIDRLGRNYDEIIKTWRELADKGIGIVVLDMPLLNTAEDKDLTGRLISDIVLQLLSYVAQTEREFIKERQREGIAIAKANGKKLGRPRKDLPPCWEIICRRALGGEVPYDIAARAMGVSLSTFYRRLSEYRVMQRMVPESVGEEDGNV